MEIRLIAVVGPTASGKTGRAVSLARHYNGEIISGDSRQVYRGMTLGTGKDLDEYGDVKYHLIDIADAGEKYNLYRYLRDFNEVYSRLRAENRFAVLCGGSGMYVESALKGMRMPEVPRNEALRSRLDSYSDIELAEMLARIKTLHNVTDLDTRQRMLRALEIQQYYDEHPDEASYCDTETVEPLDALIIGIDISREKRRERITRRLMQRLEDGMVDEVRSLLDCGIDAEALIYYGLEYKYLTLYLIGKISYNEMVARLEIAIHQFAKRQMTWFRGMERRGLHIDWLPWDMPEPEFIEAVASLKRQREDMLS